MGWLISHSRKLRFANTVLVYQPSTTAYFNDTFSFDPATGAWGSVITSSSTNPSPRYRAGFVGTGSMLFLFGGLGTSGGYLLYSSRLYRLLWHFTLEYAFPVPLYYIQGIQSFDKRPDFWRWASSRSSNVWSLQFRSNKRLLDFSFKQNDGNRPDCKIRTRLFRCWSGYLRVWRLYLKRWGPYPARVLSFSIWL